MFSRAAALSDYVFDLNEGDSSEWDDESLACSGRYDIEHHARRLIAEAGERLTSRGSESLAATVVVYQENGPVILTAQGWAHGKVRFLWSTR